MIIPLGTCISNNSGCEHKQNRTIMTLNHLRVRNLKGVELRRWQNLLLCCHDWVAAWGNHCIKHLDQIRFFHHVLHTKKINKRKRHKFWAWNSESFDWSVSLTKWDRCDYLWMSFQMGLWSVRVLLHLKQRIRVKEEVITDDKTTLLKTQVYTCIEGPFQWLRSGKKLAKHTCHDFMLF